MAINLSDLVFIDGTGYHYADYPTFLQWRTEQYQVIYGDDIYLGADSQDGQLVAIQAKSDYDTAALGAASYNARSPVSAQGTGLSTVVKINGLKRRAATFSSVDLDIVGIAGTVITNGVAFDTFNQKWLLPLTTTIPMAGTITVSATAQLVGAVQAAPATVTGIFTPTLGWQTVNNVSAAVPGAPVETDAQLRIRQSHSTADPSLTVLEGMEGGIQNLTGVVYAKIYENDTGSTDVNGIPAHSISAVVDGGSNTDICNEIALHKTPGAGTFGNTSQTVFDNHGMPLLIKFERPTVATISVNITIAVDPVTWSSDYGDMIKSGIADYINGLGIGGTNGEVLYTKLFAPAYLNGTLPGQSYDVVTLQIKKNAGSFVTSNLAIDWNELPNCDPSTDINLTVT